MQDSRVGSLLRALRIKRGWRQADLAAVAGVSRSLISDIERGEVQRRPLRTLRAVAAALGATLDLEPRWRGGQVDRLLSEGHTLLQEAVANLLESLPGWVHRPEVAFAVGVERGVIDILALHAATGSLLIIEVKTELTDVARLLEVTSRRVRLALRIAAELGWPARTVSSWIVLADVQANRRRAARVRSLLRSTAPADGHDIRSWLRNPAGEISALSFWSNATRSGATQRFAPRLRVRRAPARSTPDGARRPEA